MPTPSHKTIRLTFLITDLYLGGSPLLLNHLAHGLAKLTNPDNSPQFQITILSLKPLPPENQSAFPKKSKIENQKSKIKILSLDLTSLRTLPRAALRLREILNLQKPDFLYSILIHANLLATLTLPLLSHKPKLIHSIHTLQPNPHWHWLAQGFIAPYADLTIAPSRPILDRIAAFGPYQHGLVIPNGIDVDRFASATPLNPASLPWPHSATVIGYVGRLDPVKRVDLLLHSLATLRQSYPANNYQLAILGYGPEESALRSLATSLHLAPKSPHQPSPVHFLGPIPNVESYYKSFACLALPSSVEGFGLVLAESLAAGTPVVAVDTPVTRALVRPPIDGQLIHSLSESSLTQAIRHVTTTPHNPLSSQNHIRDHFSLTALINSHTEILRNFCA